MKKEFFITTGVLLISIFYAWIRYITFGPYTTDDFWFIVNKGLAFGIVGIMFVAFLPISNKKLQRKIVGLFAFYISLAHFLVSLILLPQKYYVNHYLPDGRLCFDFKMAIISGVVTFAMLVLIYVYFTLPKKTGVNPKIFCCMSGILYFAMLSHVYFLGRHNWINSGQWYGGLVPITLISFVLLIIFIPLGIYYIKYLRKNNA